METKDTLIMAKYNALQKQYKKLKDKVDTLERQIDLIKKSLRR